MTLAFNPPKRAKINSGPTIRLEIPLPRSVLPVYLIQIFANYLHYRDFLTMSFLSKGFFVFIRDGLPLITELDCNQFPRVFRIRERIFAPLQSLNVLNFSTNAPARLGMRGPAPIRLNILSPLRNLQRLTLWNNAFDALSLSPLVNLQKLTFLNVGEAVRLDLAFDSCLILTKLRELNISHVALTLEQIAGLSQLTGLENLNIGRLRRHVERVIPTFVTSFDFLPHLTNLETLDFSSNLAPQRTTTPSFARLTNLVSLKLCFNTLDFAGLRSLGLPASLKMVDASWTGLTADDLYHLAKTGCQIEYTK